MPEITPKPQEVIEAQIAAFATERVRSYSDSAHLLGDLGNLAAGEVHDVTATSTTPVYQTDLNGMPVKVDAGVQRSVAAGEDYKDFLRSVKGSRYEGIQGRVDILGNYDVFRPTIGKLKSELADPSTREEHPAHIGSGSASMTFTIEHEGKKYAVRVPKAGDVRPGTINLHVAGAILGRDIPHLEHMVAASYEDGVTVSEVMPGKNVRDLTPEDIRQITDSQIEEFIDALVFANDRGVWFDGKPSNFLYDPDAGFGVVDIAASNVVNAGASKQSPGDVLGDLAVVIYNAGLYGIENKPVELAEEYTQKLELERANVGVLERYRTIVGAKFVGEDQKMALERIDQEIKRTLGAIHDHSDPQWVAEDIATREQYQRTGVMHTASRDGVKAGDVW